MTTAAKRCTKCGETKPVTAFYLRRAGDPEGPRRSRCIACETADAKRRREEGPSIAWELCLHGSSNPELLSEKARAVVFPDKPIDPDLIAAYRAREKANQKRARRAELRRAREIRPMRFARMETYP